MELLPLLVVRQSPIRKLPVYPSRVNFHRNLEFAVDRMKVRWAMVSIIPRNRLSSGMYLATPVAFAA